MFPKRANIGLGISISLFLFANRVPAQSWSQLTADGTPPSAREAHTAIYDTTHNRMTLLGGYDGTNLLNDVWVLSTANGLGGIPAWTELSPTADSTYGIPTARFHHSAVYDSANNRMVIFGGNVGAGNSVNDVWVLSTANGLGTSAWTELFPTGSAPTTRYGHTAVYDTTNNLMIIFGGQVLTSLLNDVWVLSTANGLGTSAWTQLSPTPDSTYGLPTTRFSHTAVYDSANNRMILFGGWYGYKECLNDVWVLSTANGLGGMPAWTKLNPTPDPTYGFPTVRYGHTAVYDTSNNRMIIFAGTPPNLGNADVNDTWVLSHANGLGGTPAWSLVSTLGVIPSPRQYHTAVYDAMNNRMTIFGGSNNGNLLNDVWVLNNANGIIVVPVKDWMLYSDAKINSPYY